MKITIEIPDAVLGSIDKFITRYFPDDHADRYDPKTGAMLPPKPAWTPEDYIERQVQHIIDRCTTEFPTEETAAKVAQIEALKQEVANAHKCKRHCHVEKVKDSK